MIRSCFQILIALCLCVGPASAQMAVDVATLGIRDGAQYATSNRQIFYGAFDAGYQMFRFGPGTFFVDKPLRRPPGVAFFAPLDDKTTLTSQYGSWTILDGLGLSPISDRTRLKTPLTRDHFVDLNSVLDATAQGRRGFRTRSNAFLAAVGDAFAHPAGGWENLRCLTIEMVVRFEDQPGYHQVQLVGMRDENQVSPVAISVDGGNLWTGIRTDNGQVRSVSVPCPAWPSVVTLTEQIDLDTGKWLVGINGVQQVVSTAGLGADFTSGKLKFLRNDHAEFTVGVDSMATAAIYEEPGRMIDFTVGGVRFGNRRVYDDAGAGKAMKRNDGLAYNHSLLFLEGPDLISYLGNYESFDDMYQTGTITTRPWNGVAVVLQPANAAVSATAAGNRISGMTIGGGYSQALPDGTYWGYGGSLGLGPVLDYRLSGCTFPGGAYAVKSFLPTASYKTVIQDCRFGAKRNPLMLWQHMAVIRDYKIYDPGRVPMRFRWCGQVKLDQGFVAPFGPVETIVEFLGGYDDGWLSINGMAVDSEGGAYPSRALVRATGNAGQNGSEVTIENSHAGTIGPNAVILEVDDEDVPNSSSNFSIDHVHLQSGRPPFVRSLSKGWWGTVRLGGGDPTRDKDVAIGDGAAQVMIERGASKGK